MSDNIKELVKRLTLNVPCFDHRTDRPRNKPCGYDGILCPECRKKQEAADALEAMAGEVERYRESHKGVMTLQAALERVSGERASAIAERDRLAGEVERLKTEAKTATTLLEAEKWSRAHVKSIIVSDLEKERDRLKGDLSVMRLKLEAKLSTEQSEEIARLKAALEFIARGTTGSPDAIIARKALGGDAS